MSAWHIIDSEGSSCCEGKLFLPHTFRLHTCAIFALTHNRPRPIFAPSQSEFLSVGCQRRRCWASCRLFPSLCGSTGMRLPISRQRILIWQCLQALGNQVPEHARGLSGWWAIPAAEHDWPRANFITGHRGFDCLYRTWRAWFDEQEKRPEPPTSAS